jgi:hypothetical protein
MAAQAPPVQPQAPAKRNGQTLSTLSQQGSYSNQACRMQVAVFQPPPDSAALWQAPPPLPVMQPPPPPPAPPAQHVEPWTNSQHFPWTMLP